jgi:two-component system cell cycle response regulator
VVHTSTAEQALELLDEACDKNGAQDTYDVLITDFYLKGRLTGGDLLHAIRARYHFSQQELPVLVLTSDDETQKQIEVFHAGANDFVTKPIVEEILMARLRALLLIKHQYDALKRQAETMRWVAATDSLTGVRNKRYLVDNGDDYITNPAHLPVTAMLIDIDHFKSINDTLGHITGDHVLAAIGELLNSTFPQDMVVRFGGEEFCVLLSNSGREQALERAEALRRDVERLRPVDVAVTVSVGLACTLDHPKERLTRLLALADRALYRAKATGRNRVYVHTSDGLMDGPSLARVGT